MPDHPPAKNPEYPCVIVGDTQSLTKPQRNQIRQADLDEVAPVETWSIEASTQKLAYSTHGVFRYFGKFPPPVAGHLIRRFTDPGDLIIDPTGGSGTTGVEAVLGGRQAALFDINPLAILLARVKTTYVSGARLKDAMASVRARYPDGDANAHRPVGLRNPDHWFLPSTTASLSRLYSAIDSQGDSPAKDCLWAAFAATIRPVSRATTQQGRLFLDAETAQEDAWETFERRFQRLASSVPQLPKSQSVLVAPRSMSEKVPISERESGDLVVVHPPYFNAYKYSGVNSLELSWLGFDHKVTRKQEIREFFKVGKPENAVTYVDDMVDAIANVSAYVKHEGTLSLMIGDTVIKGEFVPVTRRLIDRLSAQLPALSVTSIALRVPKYTEAAWVASQRRDGGSVGTVMADYVVTFRKMA